MTFVSRIDASMNSNCANDTRAMEKVSGGKLFSLEIKPISGSQKSRPARKSPRALP